MSSLPRAASIYIISLVVMTLGIFVLRVPDQVPIATVLVLSALFVLFESVFVFVGAFGMSLSYTITLASILIVGPWGAAIVGGSAFLTLGRHSLSRRAFNAAQFALAAYVAGSTYEALGGAPASLRIGDFPGILGPIAAANFVFLLVNSLLLTGILVLAEGAPPRPVLTEALIKHSPSYVAYGVFGLVLAVLWVGLVIGPLAALLLLLPLFVARWAISQYSQEQQAYEATIRTLVQAVETKDSYTRGHSERVSRASVMIARIIGMGEDRVNALRYAGILHDVGKLGVPTKVLQKSGKLTDDEFAAIKLHPLRGMEMLGDIEFLDEAFKGILHHHERLDGLGYPMGLKGVQIPEFARVIAVADAFDSMTSTRSYRNARTVEEAIEEVKRCRGSQFDPVMVDALVKALEREPWTGSADHAADQEQGLAVATGYDHDDPSFPASVRTGES